MATTMLFLLVLLAAPLAASELYFAFSMLLASQAKPQHKVI